MNNGSVRRLLLAALVLPLALPAFAQSATGVVTGRVTDRNTQRPLGSVQVRVGGTPRATITDDAGNYRLTGVPVGTIQVTAQRIGYGPQTRTVVVSAAGVATADFTIAVSAAQLDVFVVTATGTTEQKRANGAVTATIDSSALNKAAISTFADALSSRAPGVVVQQAAGEAGAGSRVRIRGSNSISLSNEPLLIIDGARVDNNPSSSAIGTGGQLPSRLNDINPEEIENIEIIKGPAAAALYGTAAANGVIQITTKKGRAGQTRWDAYTETGSIKDVNNYEPNFRSFGHNAAGGLVTNCSLFSRTSLASTKCVAVDSTISNVPLTAAGMESNGNRGIAGASVAGGSDVATYFLSGEYQKEQNVILVNNSQRMNIRSNVRGQLTKTLDAQVSIGFTNSDLRRPQDDNNAFGVVSGSQLGKAADCGPNGLNLQHPTICGADTLSHGYYNPGLDPKAFYNINTRQGVQRLTGSLTSNWTPLAWLAVNGTFGGDVDNRNDNETLQPNLLAYSQNTLDGYRGVYRAYVANYTSSLNATATYEATPTLKLTSAVGSQYTDIYSTRTDAFGAKLLGGSNSLAGTNARFSVSETSSDVRTLGFLGREQLAWRDRVFLTVGIRSDKNSAFGQNFSRVYYPSLSGSWVLSEESYFPKLPGVTSFRLRAATGSAGQNPGYLAAEQYYTPVAVVVGSTDVPGFTIGGAGNTSLKPEKSTEVEGGFDLGLFHDRVNLEYTHYNKITKDALVNVNLAPSLGTSATRFQNLGQVRNYGDEALLRATLYDSKKVQFDVTVNGAWSTNHLDDLGVDALGNRIPDITAGFSSTQIIKAGLPLGAYYQRGLTYKDLNGDGLIGCPNGRGSADCEVTVADSASYQGSPFPAAEISVAPSLSLGRVIRFTATLDHRSGQKLFNYTSNYRNQLILNGSAAQTPSAANLAAQAAAVATTLPAPYNTYAGYFENATFTKLREVAVTLTLPDRFASQLHAGSANLTFAGRNLHTWTNYTGLDPESNAGAQSNFTTAEFLTAPQVRYFTARLALSF